jgi:hypothetical protein
MGLIINTHNILVEKTEGKRLFRRPRNRWQDNIKMDVKETGCESMARPQVADEGDGIQKWRVAENILN